MDRRSLIVLALCLFVLGVGIGRAWAHTAEPSKSSSRSFLVVRAAATQTPWEMHQNIGLPPWPRSGPGTRLPRRHVPERWRLLAQCESSGNWRDTAGYYEGGLQFAPRTWWSFKGGRFAPRADLASRREQVTVAERVLRRQGWRAWPACSRELGWR